MTTLELLNDKLALCDAVLQCHERLAESLENESWAAASEISSALITLQEKIEALDRRLSEIPAEPGVNEQHHQQDAVDGLIRQIASKFESAQEVLAINLRLAGQHHQATNSDLNKLKRTAGVLRSYDQNKRTGAYWLDCYQ